MLGLQGPGHPEALQPALAELFGSQDQQLGISDGPVVAGLDAVDLLKPVSGADPERFQQFGLTGFCRRASQSGLALGSNGGAGPGNQFVVASQCRRQQVPDSAPAVGEVPAGDRIGTAEECAADAPTNAVMETGLTGLDHLGARIGHGAILPISRARAKQQPNPLVRGKVSSDRLGSLPFWWVSQSFLPKRWNYPSFKWYSYLSGDLRLDEIMHASANTANPSTQDNVLLNG